MEGSIMSYTPKYLGHVNIFVRNAERSRQWYADVLGLHTYDFIPGRAAFMAADLNQSHEVALIQVGEDAPGPQKGQVGLNHMAWMMGSLADLKELYQRLKAREVPIDRVADHGISVGVYFHDPDGNGVEASYELPRSQWPLHEEIFSSATRPRGLFAGPWDEHRVESQLLAR
jgi:catechol-2,3-dioxygenase